MGGRRFGTVVTWFLLGGDLYTAYTFVAVPALMFGAGAVGFFAVPYTIFVYPILFAVFPRLWSVAHKHGYVTAADFVRGRFGSGTLALAIAVTGIVATMPYIALQLVGIEVVISGLGIHGEFPLIIAFVILAAYTYTSGLRAPAMIAVVKDMLIYITVIAAVIIIPAELGGYAKIFASVDPKNLLLAPATPGNLGAQSAYATLALGSALALFLYPHAVTGVALLIEPPCYTAQCGGTSRLFGGARIDLAARLHGRGGGREIQSGLRGRLCEIRLELRGARAIPADVSKLVRGRGVCRHRHRRAGAGRHHVDCLRQSFHAQYLSRIYQAGLRASP